MPQGGVDHYSLPDRQGNGLELADTGCDIENRQQRTPIAAAALGGIVMAELSARRAAVTMAFRRQSGTDRIAA